MILNTCRFGPHSKGDDTRPAEQVAQMIAQRDPLPIQAARLEAAERAAMERQEEEAIAQAFAAALSDPLAGQGEAAA